MRVWRSHLGSCAWLALLALAIQLVVSFGHFHKDDLIAGSAAAAAAGQTSERGPDGSGQAPERPDLCTICASISMAGSLVVAQPPTIITLALPREIRWLAPARAVVAGDRSHAFRARAPPV